MFPLFWEGKPWKIQPPRLFYGFLGDCKAFKEEQPTPFKRLLLLRIAEGFKRQLAVDLRASKQPHRMPRMLSPRQDTCSPDKWPMNPLEWRMKCWYVSLRWIRGDSLRSPSASDCYSHSLQKTYIEYYRVILWKYYFPMENKDAPKENPVLEGSSSHLVHSHSSVLPQTITLSRPDHSFQKVPHASSSLGRGLNSGQITSSVRWGDFKGCLFNGITSMKPQKGLNLGI